jgi:hypothetical protein
MAVFTGYELQYSLHEIIGGAFTMQEVLIIWGDHDQLFPVEKAFAVQRYN